MNENLIIIRNIPQEFTNADCKDLFAFFNSKSFRYITNTGSNGNIAYITFDRREDAIFAMLNLHERKVLNNYLSVRVLRNKSEDLISTYNIQELKKYESSRINTEWMKELLSLTPIINFGEPIKPKLRYKYPKPNSIILTNIVRALYSNENFYTQTLHLMNKFHFPIPFSPNITFPGSFVVTNSANANISSTLKNETMKDMEISSGNESEISEERYFPTMKRRKIFLPKLKGASTSINYAFNSEPIKKYPIDELFDKDKDKVENQIKFKVSASLQNLCQLNSVFVEGEEFGKISEQLDSNMMEDPVVYSSKNIKENLEITTDISNMFYKTSSKLIEKPFHMISMESINNQKLSSKLCASINAFKNYNPGNPSSRLYVKNMAKKVSRDDLISLYSGFINWSDKDEVKLFSVTCFTQGRMKGQAFINLPSKSVSEKALEMTNAFVLYDKPLVVQFANTFH